MKHMDIRVASDHSSRLTAAGRCIALPFDAVSHSNWTLGPNSDREAGNACVGIAIGCLLSLPIWLAVVAGYVLLT
jgi:hypothetical protein